jgi:KUP system potassium uptake protein
VALIVWKIKWYFVLPLWLLYATLEGLYLTSALNKVPDGAWFTLTLAIVLATVFSTWRFGKENQWASERKGRLPRLSKLVRKGDGNTVYLIDEHGGGELSSLKGLGIFFDKAGGDWVPTIYHEFVNKFEAQPGVQVFLHLRATTVPYVPDDEKFTTTRTGLPNCYRILVRYGYAETIMSKELGKAVYNELKEYITKELLPDGRSSALVNPAHGRKVYTMKNYSDEKLAKQVLEDAKRGNISAPITDKEKTATQEDESSSAPNQATNEPVIDPNGRDKRLKALEDAYKSQVLYIVGKAELQIPISRNYLRRFFLGAFLFVRDLTNAKSTSLKIPMDKMVEVGFIREL